MKKVKPFELHKPITKAAWYLKPFQLLISWYLAGPLGAKTKFKKINCEGLKAPYLVISNHASAVDFANAMILTKKSRNFWIASIDEFVGREWVMRHTGCVPKRKFTRDTWLIKNCVKMLRTYKSNIIIYPEARFSLAGVNEDIGKALGKFAKLCKVPVVVLNQKGNFIRSPQWNKHPYRKVKCVAEFIQVVTLDEIKTLPEDEIQRRIEEAFVYDDYKWQVDNNIRIKDKDRATNLHKILYKCPCCHTEQKMKSYGHYLECSECGAKWDLDELSCLHLINEDKTWDASLSHIPAWYNWEREMVNKEVNDGTYNFSDMVRIEHLVNSHKGFVNIGTISMKQNAEGITLEGTLDNGEKFSFKKHATSTPSIHIEYNYRKRGDAIDIADLEETYFVYPLNNPNIITKIHFATEALYHKAINNQHNEE